MSKRKRHWFWNLLIVLTLIVCTLAFIAHYKNWEKIEDGTFRIFSGIYYKKIPIEEIDSVMFVDRLPEMERSSGFSWMTREKGVFKDSITQTNVHVFVDDLRQEKIRLVYDDSLKVFFNFQDSLQTKKIYAILHTSLEESQKNQN